ncbi:hypothetical protein M426DRAFT_14238 [Hypoxylon sp. CI-4A]|nr:hypothetical protein M426DRAFT_14238 [Hypoxylon sp. CI-4A]
MAGPSSTMLGGTFTTDIASGSENSDPNNLAPAAVKVTGAPVLSTAGLGVSSPGVLYAAVTAATHITVVTCEGLDNSGMSEEERILLDPYSKEHSLRTLGSKAELALNILYPGLLWLTKAATLAFCRRLTERLGQYRKRIRFGFVLLGTTWLANFLISMLVCRPLSMNWQIYPDPGCPCHPFTSPYSLYFTFAFNFITGLYIFILPLPILWMANTKLWKKLGLVMLVSANCFMIVAAILRQYRIALPTTNSTVQSSQWAIRVSFVAVVTTNLPLFFPLMHRLISPLIRKQRETLPRMRTITPRRLTVSEAHSSRARQSSSCRQASREDAGQSGETNDDEEIAINIGVDFNDVDITSASSSNPETLGSPDEIEKGHVHHKPNEPFSVV